ncbi:MAG TPA: TonB-dependent receptor [Bryobacteraceae bacterium]|nr:TonB-dependent receptor [Bryobacteraceae bacterium]
MRAQLLQGTINGNVTDATQAVVAGANVTATDQATSFERTTTSNSAGVYTLPGMPPGTYTVTIGATGFQTYTKTGVVVAAQTVTRVDVSLTVGEVSQSIKVSASAAVLQADRADVHSEIGSNLLQNVPVPIGRNYQAIFATIPGVSPPQTAHSFSANSTRSLAFTVNGGNVNNNDTRIDGAGTRNYVASDVIEYVPALEAIETVNIATNSFDADQSSGGGYINVTVKSGTNSIHGSLFEDHADRSLTAYSWVADRTRPKVPFIHNQFGGTIGGPIKKDKLFYFFSYEGVRLVQGNSVTAQVPTPAMKSGNLSASPTPIYDPLTGNVDGSGRTPFTGNLIPANRIDQGVKNLIASGAWPDPNRVGTGVFGLGQDFLAAGNQGNSGAGRDQYDTKVNWNPSSKLSMFVRYGMNHGSWYDPQIFGLLGGPPVSPNNISVGLGAANVYNATLSGTYVFGPRLLMDAYFGYSRIDSYGNQPNQDKNLGWTMLQIPGLDTSSLTPKKQLEQGGLPLLSIDGFTAMGPGNTYQPQAYADPEKNFAVNVNWIKGTHNVRGGVDSDLQNSAETQYQTPTNGFISNSGGFHFAQGTTLLKGGPAGNDMNAFASFLLGLPQDSGKIYQFPDAVYTRQKSFGVYLRDRWEVSHKLTVSYGFRWDYYQFPRRNGTGVEYYNPTKSTVDICGVGSVPADCGITRDRQHFNPHFGVAYRLTDSTVIRAGYSMSTNPVLFEGFTSLGGRNFPYIYSQVLLPPNSLSYATTLRQGIPTPTAPDISVGSIPVPNYVGLSTYNNANYIRGYIQTWNLTLEQRFKNWLGSAGYVGTRDVDPQDNLQMNWSPIGGGTAGEQLNQLNGRTASTQYIGTLGSNTYDSLQTRLQGHFSGYQLNFAYTFAKALGYSINPSVQIPDYYSLNRGRQSTDITHTFAATVVADLPFGRGKRWAQSGIASKLAGGWQLSAIVTAHSGTPFTATASSAGLNAPFTGQFADCISAPNQIGSILQWYDRSTFASPAAGRFGTCGTNNLTGPGMVNENLGVNRRFTITERFDLSFRADMFNAANTPHHTLGNSSVNSGTFMQAVGIANTGLEGIEQRSVRLSIRLGW